MRQAAQFAVAVIHLGRIMASARRVGIVVLYHRIDVSAGDPARELVPAVAQRRFRQQLRLLRRLFHVVPASEILDAAEGRRRGRRIPVAVTFDDEWPTHIDVALPILRAEGVQATFFLTSAHLDGVQPFWWEVLQNAVDAGVDVTSVVPGASIFEQAEVITGAPPESRKQIRAELRELVGGNSVRSGNTVAQIRRLAGEQDVGFHTRHHDSLSSLNDASLAAALREGRPELEDVVGRPITLVAYPHGAASLREAKASQEAGFALGFTAEPEACGSWSEPHLIGRVEPGDVPAGRFLHTVVRCFE